MNQEEVFDILTMGYNVFLTGAAGSGKTFLVNRFIRHCHEHGIGVAVTASTGIAATHIGGMTIHSWSGMGIRDTLSQQDLEYILAREYLMKRFIKTHVLVIDEISMLSGGFLESLDILLQRARMNPEPFGGMQVLLVGDFFQLPPVTRDQYVEYAFEHPTWRTLKLAICVLTTQYRQSSENFSLGGGLNKGGDPLLSILSEIRSGNVSEKSRELLEGRYVRVETEDHTELFTRNVSVDAYNKEKLDSISGDIFIFEMHSKGAEKLVEALKKGCLAPEILILKIGARVMFVKNNFEAGYVNGSIGHIIGRKEGLPIVELEDGTTIVADYASWIVEEGGKPKAEIAQIPLRLAWAITVHKSQGMTLDSAVMDLSDAFVPGQGYVALSRVRSLAGLTLRGCNELALRIDPRVIAYDKILRATSERVGEKIRNYSQIEKEKIRNDAIIRLGGSLEKQKVHEKSLGSGKKVSTHEETLLYIKMGLSLEEIALEREVKVSTVVSHIEKLLEEGKEFDLEYFRLEDTERLSIILSGFEALSTDALSPVREYLFETYGEHFDFDEVRIARLFRKK
ncbi:MAG: AAA family ATPase [Candidatus Altimarinota bacterium]